MLSLAAFRKDQQEKKETAAERRKAAAAAAVASSSGSVTDAVGSSAANAEAEMSDQPEDAEAAAEGGEA